MRILLVNQTYHPDHAATAQHAHDLVRALVARGHQVTVVASRSVYGSAGAALPAAETLDGARVFRVGRSLFGKNSLAGRAADFLLFHVAAAWRTLTLPGQDVVIALTTPPLIGFSVWPAARLRGAKLVSWVMDLYPEVAVAGGVLSPRGPLTRLLSMLNRAALRRSARVVALGRCMEDRLLAAGLPREKVVVIPPWAAEEEAKSPDREGGETLTTPTPSLTVGALSPHPPTASPLTALYAGNLGLAHDVSAFQTALLRLKDDARIRFVFSGGGKKRRAMEDFAKAHALPNVTFPPYVPREQLAAELAKADVHLASQSPAFTGLVVPSKFYGTLAIGRAAAVVAPEDAEIARVVKETDCGRVFTPDAAGGEALADWLRALADDRQEAARLGKNARLAHETRHRPSLRLAGWVEMLEALH